MMPLSQGKLVLVVGASAAGKDTLMRLASQRLAGLSMRFVPREITRPCDDQREHVPVARRQFERRARAGYYLLAWAAHGVWYGIPDSARQGLRAGQVVVSIASRSIVQEAHALPWACHVIEIHAPLHVLRQRLSQRGRADGSDPRARLARARAFHLAGPSVQRVDNGGSLEVSGRAFCRMLIELSSAQPGSSPAPTLRALP